MQVKKQQLEPDTEQWTGSKLGKEYDKAIYCHCLFNLYAKYIMRSAELVEPQAGIRIAGRNINNLGYENNTTLMTESEEELKSILTIVKEECEKAGFKLNIQDHGILSYHFIANRRGGSEKSGGFYFLGLQNHCRWLLQPCN